MIHGIRHRLPAVRCLVLAFVLAGTACGDAPADSRTPPLPPAPRPAVERFIELIQASPARREELLVDKPSAARELILARIREYESLPPARREERLVQLRLAQFRHHLSQLLRAPVERHAEVLATCPESDRPLLAERLRAWAALEPLEQAALLESDASLHFFVRHQSASPDRLRSVLGSVPGGSHAEVERQFARWSALPESERARRTERFQRFFDLTPAEQARAVDTLPERDRRLMEETLAQFARLPADEQARCLEGYGRLAGLDAAERAEFLRNARRWQAMTPLERAAWRRLVQPIPPPPPLPPIPAGRREAAATNR